MLLAAAAAESSYSGWGGEGSRVPSELWGRVPHGRRGVPRVAVSPAPSQGSVWGVFPPPPRSASVWGGRLRGKLEPRALPSGRRSPRGTRRPRSAAAWRAANDATAALPSPARPPCLPWWRPPARWSRWITKCLDECKVKTGSALRGRGVRGAPLRRRRQGRAVVAGRACARGQVRRVGAEAAAVCVGAGAAAASSPTGRGGKKGCKCAPTLKLAGSLGSTGCSVKSTFRYPRLYSRLLSARLCGNSVPPPRVGSKTLQWKLSQRQFPYCNTLIRESYVC